jgi:peptidylprolyl isomerase
MLMTTDSKVLAWPQFCPGVLGMARSNDPDSANSQFFFMRAAYPTLEKKYTGFGRVLMGEDVVKSIKLGEPVADPQDFMITVRLASDLPPQDRPKLYVLDTRSAAFKAMADRIKADKGPEFSLCDVEVPAEIR